ncbi:MAG: SDR family NAD(P)-dependent oxidoreductase [Rhizobiales bacterium]|nr:SDR family NAD(P)-dependent oxidoreductase [Hyphomicrobiales bacterium]
MPDGLHAGKVALVTGANKGLGREIARRLGGLGMTVYLGARDEQRGRQAADALRQSGADTQFLQLDVTDQHSVRRAAERIGQEAGRLDVLVNNAGIAVDAERPSKQRPSSDIRATDTTAEHMRWTYDVNVFGVVAVMQAMLPLLRRAPAARVVNMSSPLGSLTLHADSASRVSQAGLLAYCSSKAALNLITLQYANALRGTGILVNAANPGLVATDLNTFSGPRTVEQGATAAVHLATLPAGGPTGVFLGDDGPVPW